MKQSIKAGLGFGITSGVITTLGLVMGLYYGTESELAIIGGIITIALSDALSDALGIYPSKEFEDRSSKIELLEATAATFVSKFFVAISFVIPVLTFELTVAMISSVIFGLAILAIFSFYIAKLKNVRPLPVITQYLGIVTVVIVATSILGRFIKAIFG